MTAEGDRGSRWAVGAVLGLVLLAHLRFLVLDPRLPWDANLAYDQLPLVLEALDKLPQPGLGRLAALVFGETTGLYDLLLAIPMALGLPRAGVVEAFGLLWVLTCFACVALIAWRLFGERAAAAAVALLAGGGAVTAMGRTTWVHVPELALALVVLAAVVLDPALRRWSAVAAASLAGGLALSLRPSAAVWVLSCTPLLVVGLLRGHAFRAAAPRLVALLLGWGLGACPLLVELAPYLQGKLDRRGGYAGVVSAADIGVQLLIQVGPVALLIGALGLVALALHARRLWAFGRRGPLLVLLGWLVLTPLLVLGFRAGLDNFPAAVVALALLGGAGLARLPKGFMLLPALAFVLGWLPQWLPEAPGLTLPEPIAVQLQARPGLAQRVDDRLDPAVVEALLDASCRPARVGRCVVVVDHGLFSPSPEDPGRLELFLLDRSRVELLPVYGAEAKRWGHEADAVASFGCEGFDEGWDARRPGWRETAQHVLARGDLRQVWERDLSDGCSYRWYTPGGTLRYPNHLPE